MMFAKLKTLLRKADAARKARGSKALVNRAIVRFVTAGTLTEEALLDARAANWCVAIGEAQGHVALAAADVAVQIPMRHGIDSLNVAAASAVAMWALAEPS